MCVWDQEVVKLLVFNVWGQEVVKLLVRIQLACQEQGCVWHF